MANIGSFSGTPKTEWLNQPAGDARDMKLLEVFVYTDSNGRRWDAPLESIINGASIPQWLWDTVGSPYTGSYRNASIVHDIACVRATTKSERKAADKMFWEACVAGGCTEPQANDLYVGVRLGAWWSPPSAATARGLRTTSTRELKRESRDCKPAFTAIRKQIAAQGGAVKLTEIDKMIEAEMTKGNQRSAMSRATAPKQKAKPVATAKKIAKKASKRTEA